MTAASSIALSVLLAGVLARGATEPSHPLLSYSPATLDGESGMATIEIQNTSGVRIAVMECPSLGTRARDGSSTPVPLSEEQSCVWPVRLLPPDSTLRFDFPVVELPAGCNYLLALQVAEKVPAPDLRGKVHDGDLHFDPVVSPGLCH